MRLDVVLVLISGFKFFGSIWLGISFLSVFLVPSIEEVVKALSKHEERGKEVAAAPILVAGYGACRYSL